MSLDNELWEVLVPTHSNDGVEYDVDYHREWDAKVREISGGLTIMRSARGEWVGPEGQLFSERMIPVRVIATEPQVDEIVQLTMSHYDQLAVLAYRISDYVKLVERQDN